MVKTKYKFELCKPMNSCKHNGYEYLEARGVRGAKLWVFVGYFGSLDHDVYDQNFKKIASISGDYLYENKQEFATWNG